MNIDIIPAIDIMDGSCVRLSRGDFGSRKIYDADPAAVAKRFEDAGLKRCHVVDLDGAKSKKIQNAAALADICKTTNLVVDFGGGIKDYASADLAFHSGAAFITAGSIAVKQPGIVEQWMRLYGADKIILGADFLNSRIAVSGWQSDSGLDLWGFLDGYIEKGIQTVISTDIDTDGMLSGPSLDIYKKMRQRYSNTRLIASGGVSSMADIHRLDNIGMDGVIVGKAIYENRITLDEIREATK